MMFLYRWIARKSSAYLPDIGHISNFFEVNSSQKIYNFPVNRFSFLWTNLVYIMIYSFLTYFPQTSLSLIVAEFAGTKLSPKPNWHTFCFRTTLLLQALFSLQFICQLSRLLSGLEWVQRCLLAVACLDSVLLNKVKGSTAHLLKRIRISVAIQDFAFIRQAC